MNVKPNDENTGCRAVFCILAVLALAVFLPGAACADTNVSISADPVVIPSCGENIIFSGNTDSFQDYRLLIIGPGFIKKDSILPVNGIFSYTLYSYETEGLKSGQYFAVLQESGYNGRFDAGKNITAMCPGTVSEEAFPRSLEEFLDELESPLSDDIYAKTMFIIEQPWIKYETVATTTDGKEIYVLASTNLPPGETVDYSLSGAEDKNLNGIVKGQTEVLKGSERNYFEVNISKENLSSGEYVLQSYMESGNKSELNQAVCIEVDEDSPAKINVPEIEAVKNPVSAYFSPEVKTVNSSESDGSSYKDMTVFDGMSLGASPLWAGLDKDRVYWTIVDENGSSLYVYNLTSGKRSEYEACSPPCDCGRIILNGNRAFYSLYDNGTKEYRIVSADLNSGKTNLVSSSGHRFFDYDSSGVLDAWIKHNDTETQKADVMVCGAGRGEERLITEINLGERYPGEIVTDGRYVAFREYPEEGEENSYFVYDTVTQKTSSIDLYHENSSVYDLKNGFISGTYPLENLVKNQKELNVTGTPYGIYIYDIEKGTESDIAGSDSSKKGPVISENRVFWTEMTDGHYEVFCSGINGLNPLRLTYGSSDCYDVSADSGYIVWSVSSGDISVQGLCPGSVYAADVNSLISRYSKNA
ncbi:hypothetical protein J2128_001602 [Methanomicrobium sp. W14]|uniref:hypothetical protein n=1 Tax=Methanomicrobium sp. W14 TaxID=2817839 RepID=UPI001AE67210|nr:hypothetical protein [Methanomicrobium sp. W14]MBP2133648.1 hypothetical protein [Methanomicrobium sp. W14]